jgi:hypothetical protein
MSYIPNPGLWILSCLPLELSGVCMQCNVLSIHDDVLLSLWYLWRIRDWIGKGVDSIFCPFTYLASHWLHLLQYSLQLQLPRGPKITGNGTSFFPSRMCISEPQSPDDIIWKGIKWLKNKMPCWNSLCSYVKQTKPHFFLLHNWRTGGQNRSCLER